MTGPASVEVELDYPITLDGGAELRKLTFRRPKGKAIKKALALLGPEAVTAIVSGEGGTRDKLAAQLGKLFTAEKLEQVTELVGELCAQPGSVIDEVDPADYPKIFGALGDFFPDLSLAGAA